MGGGFFDNVWDPFNVAYAYPRTQPRSRYYRPRAPVSDSYGSSRVPEVSLSPSKVEEPLTKKTVRTIPVTDGGVPTAGPQQVSQAHVMPVVAKLDSEDGADVKPVIAKLRSEDAAATKIQAVYRGYLVRKTQPLKQLRVIKKVKEELESFKRKLQGTEQNRKLRSDSQERLRWTEGIMALLLRLDTLQGVHPEVRLIRKAVTRELIQFQETIDSMCSLSGGSNGKDDAISEENIDTSDVAMEEAKVLDVDTDVPTVEGVEEDSDGQGVKATEDSTSDKHVPQVHSDIHDQVVDAHATNSRDESGPLPERIVEKVEFVLEPISREADAEVPMDVEKKEQILTMVPATEEVEAEPASSQNELPPMDAAIDNHEALGVQGSAASEPSEPFSEEDASVALSGENGVEDQAHHMERREDVDRLTEEAGRPVLDTTHNGVDGVFGSNSEASTACLEEKETTSGFTDQGDGWMIPAGYNRSTSLEPQCINNLQVSQPSTADDINVLSDHALLLQVLEENRKLKDAVGKLLHWGKQQNDVIHNLAARIKQLEEHHSQMKLLENEENKARKTRSIDVSLVGDRGRSLQRSEKGRRKGNSGNRSQLDNYIDSEDWPSAESDDYF